MITEITVKIQPLPEYNALALAIFHDLFAVGSAVSEIIGSGIQLTACEIMDKYSLKVVEKVIERDISGVGSCENPAGVPFEHMSPTIR